VIPVIEQLTQDFSTHRIQPVVSPHRCGANLKVSNLIAGRYLRDDTLPRFFWLLPINDGLGLRTEARTASRDAVAITLPPHLAGSSRGKMRPSTLISYENYNEGYMNV
jgi:hypothetical protein